MRGSLLALCAIVSIAARADAQVRLVPSTTRPEPGAFVRLTLVDSTGDSVRAISGTLAGEPLHFVRASAQRWRAIAGVPVDASERVTARVVVERSSRTDTVTTSLIVPPVKVASSRLSVAPRFSQPMDSATAARVADENRRAREVGRRAHATPRLWTAPFRRPRESVVTSRFGTGRLFNGVVTSRHLGVDFRGAVGEEVRAANRGVVALVDTFFLAGTLVYIDHGLGVVTSYFHLSEALVTPGDTVERGQLIGRVGESGRVTGPHLHWAARYGRLALNPLDLVRLTAPPAPPRPRTSAGSPKP